MNLFSNFTRRRIIKKYARTLGALLKRRYGRAKAYTPGQVKTTVDNSRLPANDICIGYAMYLGQIDFDRIHRELGKQCDYQAMRQEIADVCFDGDSQFTVAQAIAYSEATGGGSSSDVGESNAGIDSAADNN